MKKLTRTKLNAGFTLIEILVVIGIIAILAAVVLIAINPARQFAQARNSQRTSNVTAILNAIGQNMVDNKGLFVCGSGSIPVTTTAVPEAMTAIPSGAVEITDDTTADLGCLIPTYMPAFPFDPNGGFYTSNADYDTSYYVIKDDSSTGGGRITVFAPVLESGLNTSYIRATR